MAERRLEESGFRTQDLTNELRENQDARYQLERQVKTLADNVERLKSNVERLREENQSLKVRINHLNWTLYDQIVFLLKGVEWHQQVLLDSYLKKTNEL